MLKKILIGFAGLIALLLLIAAFMPKHYSLSAEVVINQPKDSVFAFVKLIKNQEKYSKWVMADPNVKIVYTGTDGTVGFKSSWTSDQKDVGIGEQEIIKIDDGKRLDVMLRFKKPFEDDALAYTTIETVDGNKTKLVSTFENDAPFPSNIMVPFIKKMLKKDMDINNSNLKALLEK